MNRLAIFSPLILGLLSQAALAQTQTVKSSILQYSDLVHTSYNETLTRGELLRDALKNFTQNPSLVTQDVAKNTWKYAREAYDQTEAFRFYNGPIDQDAGPEGRLNSWPLDEAYIDYTLGAPESGIIGNSAQFPAITKELLISLNELDGEKNISTGYHAIEFLLWGQDFYKDGPGQRSFEDYLTAPNAQRRAEYLNIIADLLVEDLAGLESQWRAGENNYRAQFENDKETATLKKILSGIIFMAGDELSGERMYVAYDSHGQEDEHSCFSDMTHMDVQWNFWGIERVIQATNLLNLPELQGKPLTKRIQNRVQTIHAKLASIPAPFDQAITSDAGRAIILSSVEELEALAKDLAEASVLLKAKVDY
jgi:putative iron-regulated protein